MTDSEPALPYPHDVSRRLVSDDQSGAVIDATTDLAEVVMRARAGDASGWNALFDRFHPDVYRYALARVGRSDVAEDVAQDVFVAAVRSIHTLRDTREPAIQAWFFRICRNKLIDHLRHHKDALRRDPQTASVAEYPAGDPDREIEQRMRAGELHAALDALTDDQRDILVRRFVFDQSLEGVASSTRRSIGAVKSMQHRALATLAKILRSGDG